MIDLSHYKGIIFDMDGTLVDSMGAHLEAWQATCKHFGYPFDSDYIYSLGGVPTHQTAIILNEKYGYKADPKEVADYKMATRGRMNFVPSLIEETFAIFNHYRSSMKIAVGTGADRAHAEKLLSHLGIIDKLDALVTSSDVKNGKPFADTFLSAAQQMGLSPQQCVVFEDTDIGQQAAANAGMDCKLVVKGKVQY
ncbi:beta-phosphoglucomutase family hydrolase [Alteromonas sp. C1M14]|uniref:beta-phosphoglucomutase family hydrolase n=1 Tax=Alteromonas sp. C1M14 TaxID=2841567 RepID=UPI001C0831F0|nr:beta-phosphoglucomutase family hydrolase [Alteromonas sp. C1M14]MBU2978096.1 beta-phosphoglucomutase family hydrolase [Alteromonas sp. C1M14]